MFHLCQDAVGDVDSNRSLQTQALAYRTAVPEDALLLSVLATQVFLDTYATKGINVALAREATTVYSEAELARRLDDPASEITLALNGHHVVGFLDLRHDTTSPVASVRGIEVFRLYIQAPFQGCGVGKHMLSLAEAKARARRYPHVWLTAWAANTRALDFYAAAGYQDLGATQYVFEGRAYENRVLAKSVGD
jgi:ribosomal protein S18 acetylase RimI-like enzyme